MQDLTSNIHENWKKNTLWASNTDVKKIIYYLNCLTLSTQIFCKACIEL